MPLSAEEQRRLAELEESLSADDPGFARTFTRNAPRPRRGNGGRGPRKGRIALCSIGIAIGMGTLLAGIGIHWSVSVIGFVIMLLASLALYGGVRDRSGAGGPAQATPHSQHPAGTGRQSFTEKMEERWRKRSQGDH